MAKDDGNRPKGFAGLEDMLSDIGSSTEHKRAVPVSQGSSSPQSPPTTSAKPQPAAPPLTPEPTFRPFVIDETVGIPKRTGQSNAAAKWLIGIGVICLILWLGSGKKESLPNAAAPAPAYINPTQQSYSTPAPAPAYQSAPQQGTHTEESPPFGNGLSLSANQIRYCLSESIRVGAWRNAVNTYSSSSIAAFNAGVSDYNGRCSNFRYRRGSLENVKSEVEGRRYQLLQEGLAVAGRNP